MHPPFLHPKPNPFSCPSAGGLKPWGFNRPGSVSTASLGMMDSSRERLLNMQAKPLSTCLPQAGESADIKLRTSGTGLPRIVPISVRGQEVLRGAQETVCPQGDWHPGRWVQMIQSALVNLGSRENGGLILGHQNNNLANI
jgi:hypothetical protein